MPRKLRIFISSPGDVPDERLRADFLIDKLGQEYRRYYSLESYRWEHEPLLASGHFQDAISPPSAADIVILILWSRLGTFLPERSAIREYRGLDGRAPVTGTEWEYEDALRAAKERGAPDILAFRNISPAPIDTQNPEKRAQSNMQLDSLDRFWRRHFADRGVFRAAYSEYSTLEEFAVQLERALRKLIERHIRAVSEDYGASEGPTWLSSPFRGLQSYEFEHAAIYFGREAYVAKAAAQLAGRSRSGTAFLLISGASGSGKSSLVKAALVPRLMKPQRIQGAEFLRRVLYRPASGATDLILGLCEALSRDTVRESTGLPEILSGGQTPEQFASNLRTSPESAAFVISGALGRLTEAERNLGRILPFEEAKLIIIIDQLEEIFTSSQIRSDDRQVFFTILTSLARSGAVWIVATLRSDFWSRAAEYRELVELSSGDGRLELLPPSPAELADIIRKPAQVAGLIYEDHSVTGLALDAVIAEAASSEPGVLPLLSFTLEALYAEDVERRHGRVLRHDTYSQQLGGLEGAIARRADEILNALSQDAQQALPRVLRALTTVAPGVQHGPTARTVPYETFASGTTARQLVDALVAGRLLVVLQDDRVSATVRFAHEALLSKWATATEQLAKDRRDLEVRELVEGQQARWQVAEGSGRKQLLLRDPDLANAVDLERRWQDELSSPIRSYIHASISRARLQQRLIAASAIAFGLLAIAAGGAAYLVSQERQRVSQSLDFLSNVAETFQELSGVVPEETEELMRESTSAFLIGARNDSTDVRVAQVKALQEMSRFFRDSWDPLRASKFLEAADTRLAQVKGGGTKDIQLLRLSAYSHEIRANLNADDVRTYDEAIRGYTQALHELEVLHSGDPATRFDSARIHRKLAEIGMDQRKLLFVREQLARAQQHLGNSADEVPAEHAALNAVLAALRQDEGDMGEALSLRISAVEYARQGLDKAKRTRLPVRRLTVSLSTYLQHLGDAYRLAGNGPAAERAYDEAELLIRQVLDTYPNQSNSRFVLDLIRHGKRLLVNNGNIKAGDLDHIHQKALQDTFGEGVGAFRFGMTTDEVNRLLPRPFHQVAFSTLPSAREYKTGDVRYFWNPISALPDFQAFYRSVECLVDSDYVVFMFHENALIRISVRLFGGSGVKCPDRADLFPELAQRFNMPIIGTPRQWRLHWQMRNAALIGTSLSTGPMLDIVSQ